MSAVANAADPNEGSSQAAMSVVATSSTAEIPVTSRVSTSEAFGISNKPSSTMGYKQLHRVAQTDTGWWEKIQNNRELKKICDAKGWDFSHYQLSKFKDETGSILWIPEKISDFQLYTEDTFTINIDKSNNLIYSNKMPDIPNLVTESIPGFFDIPLSDEAQILPAPHEVDHGVNVIERAEIVNACKPQNLNPDYYYLKEIPIEDTFDKRPVRQLTLQPSIHNKIEEAKFSMMLFINQLEDTYKNEVSLDEHIKGCVQTMVDGKEHQDALLLKLQDPAFCRDNFIDIVEHHDNQAIFTAKFKDDELVFSNRSSSAELRGARLKELLQKFRYTSLHHLVSQTHLTKHDPYLINMASIVSAEFNTKFNNEETALINLIKNKVCYLNLYGYPLFELLPQFFEAPDIYTQDT